MFLVLPWQFYLFSALSISPKSDFTDVEIAMFQEITRHWEHISFLLTRPKFELDEAEKR